MPLYGAEYLASLNLQLKNRVPYGHVQIYGCTCELGKVFDTNANFCMDHFI